MPGCKDGKGVLCVRGGVGGAGFSFERWVLATWHMAASPYRMAHGTWLPPPPPHHHHMAHGCLPPHTHTTTTTWHMAHGTWLPPPTCYAPSLLPPALCRCTSVAGVLDAETLTSVLAALIVDRGLGGG